MKKVRFFVISMVFSSYFLGCKKSGTESQTESTVRPDTIKKCNVLKFDVSNSGDIDKFGYIEWENGPTVSATSICVGVDRVFLVDDFNKNIKSVDLKTSILSFSRRLTNSNHSKFLNDIGIFQGLVYVTTTENTVYILSPDLQKIDSIRLPFSNINRTYIMANSKGSLTLLAENADSCFTINENNKIISSRPLTNDEKVKWVDKFNLSKGVVKDKELAYKKGSGGDFIDINLKTIALCEPFEYCEEAINLDFDEKTLAIFNVDKQYLKLFLYNLSDSTMPK